MSLHLALQVAIPNPFDAHNFSVTTTEEKITCVLQKTTTIILFSMFIIRQTTKIIAEYGLKSCHLTNPHFMSTHS